MEKYLTRITDHLIKRKLELFGAVCIEGPKWCGKTTSCKQFAKTIIEFQNPEKRSLYQEIISIDPQSLLNGSYPILFDEWQQNPTIWDTIRHSVDNTKSQGLYLLTGSNSVDHKLIMHSGTGRITRVRMRPMSLFESGDSTGQISLNDLFNKRSLNIHGESPKGINDLTALIVRGGFPIVKQFNQERDYIDLMSGYYDSLVNEDVSNIDRGHKNPHKMNTLLKSYARNICTTVSDATIKKDMENEGITISDKTFLDYKNVLERLFIIESIPAWPTSIRSKTAMRKSAKKQFADPSIACAALKLNSNIIIRNLNYLGFLFESLCLRDLKIYAESIDCELYHYREEKGFEIDCIIELRDGVWGAIEIKLGANHIDKAATNLLKLKEKIDINKKGEPHFLMIIYGGKYAYRRSDGVLVVPITCLKN